MIVCGIEMSGSEAKLVLLDGMKTSFSHIDIQPRKITGRPLKQYVSGLFQRVEAGESPEFVFFKNQMIAS